MWPLDCAIRAEKIPKRARQAMRGSPERGADKREYTMDQSGLKY